MSEFAARAPSLLGIGIVDASGVRGTILPHVPWWMDGDPLLTPGVFRRLFGRSDPTYRRIDRMSRALVLAAEASGVARFSVEERNETAVVLETMRGCLESDLEFAAALETGTILGPLFPYTLPSTCLGEVALRHGLRGPTLCLSTTGQTIGSALWQARALIEEGEATHAIAASVEVLARGVGDVPPALRAVVVCLGPHESGAKIAPWPAREEDAFAVLAFTVLASAVPRPSR